MKLSSNQVEASITLRYPDEATAEAILSAVDADNQKLPEGLTIAAEKQSSTLVFTVKCRKNIGSLTATLDDLLSCVSAAEKSIGSVSFNAEP